MIQPARLFFIFLLITSIVLGFVLWVFTLFSLLFLINLSIITIWIVYNIIHENETISFLGICISMFLITFGFIYVYIATYASPSPWILSSVTMLGGTFANVHIPENPSNRSSCVNYKVIPELQSSPYNPLGYFSSEELTTQILCPSLESKWADATAESDIIGYELDDQGIDIDRTKPGGQYASTVKSDWSKNPGMGLSTGYRLHAKITEVSFCPWNVGDVNSHTGEGSYVCTYCSNYMSKSSSVIKQTQCPNQWTTWCFICPHIDAPVITTQLTAYWYLIWAIVIGVSSCVCQINFKPKKEEEEEESDNFLPQKKWKKKKGTLKI
jgi:hypothetical protein